MTVENRMAFEFIVTSAIRTNDTDRAAVLLRLPAPTDVDRLIHFLLACPKIIHFHPDKVLQQFVTDTEGEYKNQFLTGVSSGTLSAARRIAWEGAMFGNAYGPSATATRPKYGVVKLTSQPDQWLSQHYGRAYLVLRGVENRVTYSYGDSGVGSNRAISHHQAESGLTSTPHGVMRQVMGVGVWMCRLLKAMTASDLECIRQLSLGQGGSHDVLLSQRFIEIQIHGPVRFQHDVQEVVLPRELAASPGIVAAAGQFSTRFHVPVRYTAQ